MSQKTHPVPKKPKAFKRPRMARQIQWAADMDEKFIADLNENPEAAEWYAKFLQEEYDMGAFKRARQGEKVSKAERKEAARRVVAQRRDAMNNNLEYLAENTLDSHSDSEFENQLASSPQDFAEHGTEYLDSPVYKELLEEFRKGLKEPRGTRYQTPEASARRQRVRKSLELLSNSAQYSNKKGNNHGEE